MIDRTELWSRILTRKFHFFWLLLGAVFFTYCAVGLGKREVSGDLREILVDGVLTVFLLYYWSVGVVIIHPPLLDGHQREAPRLLLAFTTHVTGDGALRPSSPSNGRWSPRGKTCPVTRLAFCFLGLPIQRVSVFMLSPSLSQMAPRYYSSTVEKKKCKGDEKPQQPTRRSRISQANSGLAGREGRAIGRRSAMVHIGKVTAGPIYPCAGAGSESEREPGGSGAGGEWLWFGFALELWGEE
jgi:hypothetical protein